PAALPISGGTPAAVAAGAVVALGLLALAAIAIRDLTVRAGWVHGTEWLRGATHWGADAQWRGWMWPVTVVLIIAGLLLLWLAVKPRTHRYVSLGGHDTVLWTRPGDIARRCSAAVRAIPGVREAHTVYSRRRVRVTVDAVSGMVDEATVTAAVQEALAPWRDSSDATPPKVKVTLRQQKSGGDE
ncbi:MAG: DUF6286 domain-containing protein, partial [Gordonia sp. (in: high G+C Gram-positive bacteria)]